MTSVSELLDRAVDRAAAGAIDEALAAYSEVLARSPRLPEVHYNVAALRLRKGDVAGAEASLREALELRPDWPQALLALGHVAFTRNRFEDAERAFERAAALEPQSAEAVFNQALALDRLGAWGEALPLFRRARELAPEDQEIWRTLRALLLRLRREEEAYEDFLAFEPRARASAALAVAGLVSSRIAPGARCEEKYLPLALDWPYGPGESGYAGAAAAHAEYFDVSRAGLKRLHQTYDRLRQYERTGVADLASPRPATGRALRIGYLSADFRHHVMGRLMLEVLRRHDRARFSVSAYSLGRRETEDAVTAEFRGCCRDFVRLDELSNFDAARRIAADELDLLIDLMSHSGASRPGILLYKPAPVIVTHLGSHGPIGLRQVDFKLSDRHSDLPDAGDYQIEKPLALDCCLLPVRRVAPATGTMTRAQVRLAPDAVTFGAFADLRKLSPRGLSLWRAILDRVPRGALVFSIEPNAEPLYLRRLESFGISAARVRFIPWTRDDAADRARYRLIDVVLDTLPYTGGDSTAAALDMGVPVVTRVGERAAERIGWSLLAHLGVTDTAAHSDAQYVEIACRLADDALWRSEIAAAIAARLPRSGLADFECYTRALEAAYERAVAARSPGDALRG
ncbi:MAG TPA: tetratricopeptide repeat protein [Casimicrobiaceae bacterium]|nr:tetratricopeptide repeat protein [Casimicrobiaceae bacterium]